MTTAKKSSIPKVNGFTRGLNTLQIISYVLMVVKIFIFSYVLLPNFLLFVQIIAAITYYPLTILTIVCGYLATADDPTDEVVTEERRCKLEGEPFDSNRYDYQCNYCNTSVSRESKHCRECDRCVKNFDHHCKWVNNCVAKTNYKLFVTLLVSVFMTTLIFSIYGVVFIIDYYCKTVGVIQDVQSFTTDNSQNWKAIFLIITVALMSIVTGLSGRLLSFHLYLIRHNMSTYDYLMDLREKEGKPRGKGGKEQKNKIKITPTEGPPIPENEDEDKKAFRFEGDNENLSLNAEQLMKMAKLKKLALNLESTNRTTHDQLGIEQVLHQHQTSDDLELTQQLSIKSPHTPNSQAHPFDNSSPGPSHSPKAHKFTIPIAPPSEKRLKELLSNELPPVRPKHRVLKKAVITESLNGDQTTASAVQDSSVRKRTSMYRNLTKEIITMGSTEEKIAEPGSGTGNEVRIKMVTSIYKDNLLAGSRSPTDKV